MSKRIDTSTCSPALEDGRTPYSSHAIQPTLGFGPDRAPANPTAQRGNGEATPTSETCGRTSGDSSASVALQWSLESRLRARMAGYGSPEYELTWKHWVMPLGLPILAQRASERRTSANDCGGRQIAGWLTPKTATGGGQRQRTTPGGGLRKLEDQALLAGWPTPVAETRGRRQNDGKRGIELHEVIAGWATPCSRDWRSESATSEHDAKRDAHPRGKPLSYQAHGATASGSHAQAEKCGVLNPALSRWLMGYPPEWDVFADSETP